MAEKKKAAKKKTRKKRASAKAEQPVEVVEEVEEIEVELDEDLLEDDMPAGTLRCPLCDLQVIFRDGWIPDGTCIRCRVKMRKEL